MTYLHIDDQGPSRHALGARRNERRIDCVTEENIHDALRARGMAAAAQALDFQCVDLATAMRVLMSAGDSRARMTDRAPSRMLFEPIADHDLQSDG